MTTNEIITDECYVCKKKTKQKWGITTHYSGAQISKYICTECGDSIYTSSSRNISLGSLGTNGLTVGELKLILDQLNDDLTIASTNPITGVVPAYHLYETSYIEDGKSKQVIVFR